MLSQIRCQFTSCSVKASEVCIGIKLWGHFEAGFDYKSVLQSLNLREFTQSGMLSINEDIDSHLK